VPCQHLARYLRITRLVSANQTEAIAAKNRHQTVKQEKSCQPKQRSRFRNFSESRESGSDASQQPWR
jgi:hypothetical protein